MDDYRRNEKKQEKASSTGNLNGFIIRAKKLEPPKKEKEAESEQKENEEKRESAADILLTLPKPQVNMSHGLSNNSDVLDLKRTVKEANKLAGTLQNILNSKKSDAKILKDEIDERIAEQKKILTLSTNPEDLMHRSGGLIWDLITEEEGVACHTCYDAFKKHEVKKQRTENEDPIRWTRPKSVVPLC